MKNAIQISELPRLLATWSARTLLFALILTGKPWRFPHQGRFFLPSTDEILSGQEANQPVRVNRPPRKPRHPKKQTHRPHAP